MSEGERYKIRVTATEFLSRPLDTLTFYDVLPGEIEIVDAGGRRRVEDAAGLLLSTEGALEDESLVDDALVGASCGEEIALAREQIKNLADAASKAYADLLGAGKSRRSLRMKLQQLNFFLRAHLDRDIDVADQCRETRSLGAPTQPWDWLDTVDGRVMIVSGADNLLWDRNGITGGASCGLPSQLDVLPDAKISVGSIFTNGAWVLGRHSLTRIAHHRPLVLLFSHHNEDWAVDYDGRIFPLAQGVDSGLKAPIDQVDRARLVGRHLFLSDWSRIGSVLIVDLELRSFENRTLPGVLILNDICSENGRLYAVCKQQGYVFGYDLDFAPRGTRLGFGRGHGRLFDPVSIRVGSDGLQALNWVTGTVVTLPPF